MNNQVPCPVCATKTKQEAMESQLLVLTGVEAIFNHDRETVKAVYDSLTPYDGHTAISLLALEMADMFDMYNQLGAQVDVKATMANYRAKVQETLFACE